MHSGVSFFIFANVFSSNSSLKNVVRQKPPQNGLAFNGKFNCLRQFHLLWNGWAVCGANLRALLIHLTANETITDIESKVYAREIICSEVTRKRRCLLERTIEKLGKTKSPTNLLNFKKTFPIWSEKNPLKDYQGAQSATTFRENVKR